MLVDTKWKIEILGWAVVLLRVDSCFYSCLGDPSLAPDVHVSHTTFSIYLEMVSILNPYLFNLNY